MALLAVRIDGLVDEEAAVSFGKALALEERAAERARIRREMTEALDAWAEGAPPYRNLRGAVAAEVRAVLDRIASEEG